MSLQFFKPRRSICLFLLVRFSVEDLVVKEVGEVFLYPLEFSLSEKGVTVVVCIASSAYLPCQLHKEKYLNFFILLIIIDFLELFQWFWVALVVKNDMTEVGGPFCVFIFLFG